MGGAFSPAPPILPRNIMKVCEDVSVKIKLDERSRKVQPTVNKLAAESLHGRRHSSLHHLLGANFHPSSRFCGEMYRHKASDDQNEGDA